MAAAISDRASGLTSTSQGSTHVRTSCHPIRLTGGGLADFKKTEPVDVDKLDGTFFIRAAALTDKKIKKGGEVGAFWDRDGFYNLSK